MKIIIVLASVVAATLAIPADTYDPAYDSFNAQEVADNDRLLKNYVECFLDRAPCTSYGKDFKKIIPEALVTTCAKCTPKQRELIRIMVRGIQQKLPEMWTELVKKEDPTGQYKESFEAFLNATD